jgi:hypothetical protein
MHLILPTRGPIELDARGESVNQILLQVEQVVPRVFRARSLNIHVHSSREVLAALANWCREQQVHALVHPADDDLRVELFLVPPGFGSSCVLRPVVASEAA